MLGFTGVRKWVYPKDIQGTFTRIHYVTSAMLVFVLAVVPWLRWNGQHWFLADVAARRVYLFGTVFTDGLKGLEAGRWAGPVESGFGLHLVWVDDRVPARAPQRAPARGRGTRGQGRRAGRGAWGLLSRSASGISPAHRVPV